MKKNILKLSAISLVASALLVGCGSDSSLDDSSLNTGYFIDAAVQNAHYETTSGLSGETDNYGRFKYHTGDKVKFSIGKLILGETEPSTNNKITPKTLISDNLTPNAHESQTITLMLQMLQSLDSDNNTSNGITIGERVVTELENLTVEHHIKDLNEATLLALNSALDATLDTDFDGHLDVTEAEATSHFKTSVQEYENGHKPDYNENKDKHGNSKNEHGNSKNEHGDFNLTAYSVTENLATSIKEALAYMGNEERLAYDVYNYIYDYQLNTNDTKIKTFTNIANKSEIKHIQIVKDLVSRYDINDTELSVTNINNSLVTKDSDISLVAGTYNIQKIQDLYNTLTIQGQSSKEEALKVGCIIEVVDVNDLDEYIEDANSSKNNATDVVAAFNVLRDGSYKHYWAFDKTLKEMGVTNGCYVQGDSLLTNKDGIYPQD